jgi:hypothetical protein
LKKVTKKLEYRTPLKSKVKPAPSRSLSRLSEEEGLEDLDTSLFGAVSLKTLPGGIPWPGAPRGRRLVDTEEVYLTAALELPQEKKVDKLLSTQRKLLCFIVLTSSSFHFVCTDYLPNLFTRVCALEAMLLRERAARRSMQADMRKMLALLEHTKVTTLPEPEPFEPVTPKRHALFPTDDISLLRSFFEAEENWDAADAHFLHCLQLVTDHHFIGRFIMCIAMSFMRRPLANVTTWGFSR